MKLALMNIDKFVAVNNLAEVSNPILLDRSYRPTDDGLLSTEIFGSSSHDRRTSFAYIDLNCHVFQPLAYKNIKRLDRRIVDLIGGKKNFIITKEGHLEENENGETGIDWLYKNWDKIKFKRNNSKIRNQRIDFFECHSKNEIFQSKQIVLPAFYRDINLQSSAKGKPAVHVVNMLYNKLIRYAGMLNQGEFTFTLNYTKYQIQNTVEEIYTELKSKIEKKRGHIKQAVMGKNIDYGLRVVISAGTMNYNTPADMIMDFRHAGVPLHFCISLFQPFFVGWVQNFFKRQFELMGNKIAYHNKKTGEVEYKTIVDPLIQFSDEKIHEMMKTFIFSREERFRIIEIELEDGTTRDMAFRGFLVNRGDKILDKDYPEQLKEVADEENIITRSMTLTDLFYIAADEIVTDKHLYVTRYPMADYAGIFPIGIAILSTVDTVEMKIGDKVYKHYPKVDLNATPKEVSGMFIEVINMMNTYLKAIGGDFDGDQITAKGVYSQEANMEAARKMYQLSNILTINGSNIRLTTIEAIQGLYMTTRWANPNEEKVKPY